MNYQDYITEADKLSGSGKHDEAIELYKLAITEHPNRISAYYKLALTYHSIGRYEEALENFTIASRLNPLDPSIFNNLGVIYYEVGDISSAKEHFVRALRLNPNHAEAIRNMGKCLEGEELEEFKREFTKRAESLCEDGQLSEAKNITLSLVKLFPDDPELQNDLAVICYKLGKFKEAKLAIDKAFELCPQDELIRHNRELIYDEEEPITATTQGKIAFFCNPDDKFLTGIMDLLSDTYEVKRFPGGTIQEMHELMKWSDISWFEWCDEFIIYASKLPKVCKTICRLHSYEAFTDAIRQVNWQNVDDLIFVAPHIRDIVIQQMPSLPTQVHIHVINNGVDLKKFSFVDKKKGFNIAYVGYINHKKNPSLLLQCLKYLIDIDNRYVLHIAGQHQELRFQLYFDHMVKEMKLEDNIVFHGWIEDVPNWLKDKHYTVSTSVLESFCYGIADAMAVGLKPLIHNFVGAKELYPQKYIFNDVKEFAEMVLSDDYNPSEYREFIEKNYSLDRQINAINSLISERLKDRG